jgi:[acyl-carrier-protein] S-malonyltransferase
VGAVAVLGPLIHQVHPDLPVRLASGPGAPIPTEQLPEPALAGPAATRGVT